jgi:hypothetical protein
VSFVAFAETQVNIGKDASNLSKSPSYCDYSSMVGCPTCLMPFLSHAYFLCEKLWLLFAD